MRRSWRLNERHYGDLTGKDKKETAEKFGIDQVKLWRRSYDVPPPPMPEGDPRTNHARPALPRRTRRIHPRDRVPEGRGRARHALLRRRHRRGPAREAVRGGAVLVVAHGNSLRALRKVLQNIDDDDIAAMEIPTGIPYRIRMDDELNVVEAYYLGDQAAAAAAAEAVARQAG